MRKFLIFIVFNLLNIYCKSQVNYVLNGGFEQFDNCPTTQEQIFFANHWNTNDTVGTTNGYASIFEPDYFNTCATNLFATGAGDSYGIPRTGNALIASVLYSYETSSNFDGRDYAKGKLTQQLITGKSYCGKFYTKLYPYSSYAINKIGAYLDDGVLYTSNTNLDFDSINGQINTNSVISDTTNWIKIENVFVSNGNESFITLGSFKNHLNVQAILINSQLSYVVAAYKIDDVSVVDHNLPAIAGTDALIANGDSVYLGRPNEIGPECRWWANGAVVDSNLGFWAKPTQPTQYVLEQKICGNVKYDTVFVNMSGHDGLNSPTNLPKGEAFRLVPNPASSVVNIEGKQSFTSIEIFNSLGSLVEKIITKPIVNYKLSIDNYNKGIYILKVADKNGVQCLKLVVE